MHAAVASPSESSTALLEREAPLAALRAALAESVAGRGSLVFIGGEAGVGKTTLVRAFCAEASSHARVLWGACDPLSTPRPLGPFVEVAAEARGPLQQAMERGASPYEIVESLSATIQREPNTVLVVEDVHWADEATLDVLRLLARKIERERMLAVATYRDDELDREHPLRVALGVIATRPAVGRLPVAPLSRPAVTILAASAGIDAEELYRKTSGNAFFVTEILARGDGQIPHSVVDAVLARTARLTPSARAVIDAVAVVPPRAEPWLLEALVGESIEALDECVGSGTLRYGHNGVEFRHELARLAVEGSIEPQRRLALHRRALTALRTPPDRHLDLIRLAHHASAAGDVDAVLAFAPAAGDRASSLGAHREAATLHESALRYSDALEPSAQAVLLRKFSHECYLTDRADDAIQALESAVACYRRLGDRLREGDTMRTLSGILWCPGRIEEARRTGREAVAILEQLRAGPELAHAYINQAFLCAAASDTEAAQEPGRRALELATRLGDPKAVCGALLRLGEPERAAELAERNGFTEHMADALLSLAEKAAARWSYCDADRYLEQGLAYCTEHGNDLIRLYLLAVRSQTLLERGRWAEAAESATLVLRERAVSTKPRTLCLAVLGLVRARRGDPGVLPLLAEAGELAYPTGELGRMAPVATAAAEAAWLLGDLGAVRDATDTTRALAVRMRSGRIVGELEVWRRRSGIDEASSAIAVEPYALELAGQPTRAAAQWAELGLPYEAALARAAAETEEELRRSLDELNRLGARPAASIVARRLRERGVRGVPRGARASTRGNAAGLTTRELRRARAGRRGAAERGDRRAPLPLATHGRPPRLGHPPQARRPNSRRGGRRRRSARAAPRSVTAPRNLGNSTDFGSPIAA